VDDRADLQHGDGRVESEGDVFSEHIGRRNHRAPASGLSSLRGIGIWSFFWHQFGNSLYIAAMTTLLWCSSVDDQLFVGRMRIRNGWLVTTPPC